MASPGHHHLGGSAPGGAELLNAQLVQHLGYLLAENALLRQTLPKSRPLATPETSSGSSRDASRTPSDGPGTRAPSPGPIAAEPLESLMRFPNEAPSGTTTLMLRHIPNGLTRSNLMALLDLEGFEAAYDFLYLPMDLDTHRNLGYAFVNLVSAVDAANCRERFRGFLEWPLEQELKGRPCEVEVTAVQGREAQVEKYRNSPLMHESVPEEFKPVVLDAGVLQPFPEPTRSLRRPRKRPTQGGRRR